MVEAMTFVFCARGRGRLAPKRITGSIAASQILEQSRTLLISTSTTLADKSSSRRLVAGSPVDSCSQQMAAVYPPTLGNIHNGHSLRQHAQQLSPPRRPHISKQQFCADLSQCLFDFVVQLLPTPEELAIKEDVRKLLERLIRTIEPDSRLLSFGSTANGFSLRNSGMDPRFWRLLLLCDLDTRHGSVLLDRFRGPPPCDGFSEHARRSLRKRCAILLLDPTE